ncbi:MAG: ATP-binding protein, partial [Candidatus Sungbacteria bacterium]|nr:ATP-binding protein [Candidatus Sungbacteria bacterium]
MQSFTGDYFYATNGEVLYNSTEVPMKDSADKDVPLIAVTGGPCSGKSTGKVAVVERFNDFGYSVLTPPEVATELFTNGAAIGGLGLSPGDFQEQVLLMQLERENRYLEIAKRLKNPKCIVLTDRGCLDGDAYMPPGEFAKLIRGMGLGRYELLSRYKSAHHLVTAADGAPGFYTTENNSARKETPEEAICLDRRTRDAWVGVSHLQVIDNSTGFEEKIARLIKGICSVLGIPVPLEIERKFIVRMPVFPPDVVMCSTDIEQA